MAKRQRRARARRQIRQQVRRGQRPSGERVASRWIRRGRALALSAVVAVAGGAAATLRADPGAWWSSLVTASLVADAAPAPSGPSGRRDTAPDPPEGRAVAESSALAYAGHDARHRPRYVQRAFSDEERTLLRRAFGIADPNRLWLPDSLPTSVLRYDATEGGLAARVGYRSWRLPGETWEAFADRLQRLPRTAWPASARQVYRTGLGVLEPEARTTFAALLADARAAGFRVRLLETDRSPERQAYLLAHGNGRTLTATSAHVYGRAVDIVVGDGNIHRTATRRDWIAFRRWVLVRGQGRLRLIGTTADTWDWPHVELVDPPVGFRTIDALLAAARTCLSVSVEPGTDPCAVPRADSAAAVHPAPATAPRP